MPLQLSRKLNSFNLRNDIIIVFDGFYKLFLLDNHDF
nr:MAG TPA: hypothetical protein [Caudoviricetes sp.]